jgi:hypothetical protein
MAARDMLSLDTSIAPKLLRCLYTVALVLILIGTALGIVRGVRVMTAPPPPSPPAMAAAAPGAAAPTAPMPPPMAGRRMGPRMGMGPGMGPRMGMRRGFGRFHRRPGPLWMRGMPPAARGGILILFALFRGIVALLVVRVLAEMGLAVLSLKRD